MPASVLHAAPTDMWDVAHVGLAAHAKDEQARSFYERYDFIPSPSGPLHLFLLLKDVRAMLAEDCLSWWVPLTGSPDWGGGLPLRS